MNLKRKFSRILSLSVVLCLLLSFAIPVSAETADIALTYLNADNSAIHLEFNNGAKVADLGNKLSLFANGLSVNYTLKETVAGTVSDATYGNGASSADNSAVLDSGVTYTIVPTGGITFDVPYTVKVAEGLATLDGTCALSTQIVKNVIVREIFTEDFTNDYSVGNVYNTFTPNTASYDNQTLKLNKNANVNFAVSVVRVGTNDVNFANTTIGAKDFATKYAKGEGKENTTISVKVKAASDSETNKFMFITNWLTSVTHQWDMATMYTPQFTTFTVENNKEMTVTSRYGTTNADENKNDATYSKKQVSYKKTLADGTYKIPSDKFIEVKVSELDGKIKTFIDNTNIVNLKNATNASKGMFAFKIANVDYYVDDICMTKMEEYVIPVLEYKGVTADENGAVIEMSARMDVNALKNAITFTKDGEAADFTLTEVPGEGFKYLLVPAGGVMLDASYAFTIAAGIASSDGLTQPMEEAVSGDFMVSLDPLTVSYFDADASAINLELSHDVVLNTLKSAISLTENGKPIDFTVTDGTITNTTSQGGLVKKTYQIVPTGGMKFETAYKLNIPKGLISSDGEANLKANFEKLFKVEKILYDAFNYANDEILNDAWLRYNNHNHGIENGAVKYTTKNTTEGYMLAHPYGGGVGALIGDSGMKASQFSRTFMQTQKNYTVQADFKVLDPTQNYTVSLLALHKGIPETASGEYNSFNYRMRYGAVHDIIRYQMSSQVGIQSRVRTFYTKYKADGGFDDDEFEPLSDTKKAEAINANKISKSGWVASLTTPALSADEYKTVRLSVRDGYVKGYLGNINTVSYFDENIVNATGGAGFVLKGAEDQVIYIDNMYITRMVDLLPVYPQIATGTENVELNTVYKLSAGGALETNSVSTSTVKVKTDDGYLLATDYTVGYENDIIAITFKKNLLDKTWYYVELNGVKFAGAEEASNFEITSFKTQPVAFEVDEFKATNAQGAPVTISEAVGNTTVKAVVKNNRLPENQTFVVSVCIYDETNKLVAVQAVPANIAAGADAVAQVTYNFEAGHTYKAKCFVWSDFENMTEVLEEETIE